MCTCTALLPSQLDESMQGLGMYSRLAGLGVHTFFLFLHSSFRMCMGWDLVICTSIGRQAVSNYKFVEFRFVQNGCVWQLGCSSTSAHQSPTHSNLDNLG